VETDIILKSAILFFVLLNPFLMSIYLLDIIQEVELKTFARIILRATIISLVAFSLFVLGGDTVFTKVFQVRFESFLIFGGIIFLMIGLRFVFEGSEAIRVIRGDPGRVAGSIAMPFMIGPGTIGASVLAGTQMGPQMGLVAMSLGVIAASLGLFLFKIIYDQMRTKNHRLFERYVDITGRVSSLWIGAFAIQMIMSGIKGWGF